DLVHRRHPGGQDDRATGAPQLGEEVEVGHRRRRDLVDRRRERLEEVHRLLVPRRREPQDALLRAVLVDRPVLRPAELAPAAAVLGRPSRPRRAPAGARGRHSWGVRFWNFTASHPDSTAPSMSFLARSSDPLWLIPISAMTKTGSPTPTQRSPIRTLGALMLPSIVETKPQYPLREL